ncbi:MAG TPA: FAD-dependent oxidoreductase [Gemmatimonadaceae bacterium]
MPPISSLGGDVIIIGAGLSGLATAAALASRGADITLLAGRHAGEASRAAAGMLAPGMERASGAAHTFALAARDLYPSYVHALAEITGVRVPLNRAGILELIIDEAKADARRQSVGQEPNDDTQWIDQEQLRTTEPAAAPAAGAVLYPNDGSVDNVVLVRALRELADASPAITVVEDLAISMDLTRERPSVCLPSGDCISAATLILAAGAWSPLIPGLPRPIPIEPVRGQAIAVSAAPLQHVIYGPHGYVVPREHSLSVVGATMEHVGFETGTTPEIARKLAAAGVEIAPALSRARTLDHWCGFRPVTPDLLPIIGRDPEYPALIYACGHSRNGILLGPLTGECVAAIASAEKPTLDISPFSITRFGPPA